MSRLLFTLSEVEDNPNFNYFGCHCKIVFFIFSTLGKILSQIADIAKIFIIWETFLLQLPILHNWFFHFSDDLENFDSNCRYCKIFHHLGEIFTQIAVIANIVVKMFKTATKYVINSNRTYTTCEGC